MTARDDLMTALTRDRAMSERSAAELIDAEAFEAGLEQLRAAVRAISLEPAWWDQRDCSTARRILNRLIRQLGGRP